MSPIKTSSAENLRIRRLIASSMETSSDGQAYNTHQCQHNCMQSTDSADKEVFGPQSNSRRPRTSSDSTLVVEVSDSDEGPQPAAVTAMQRLGAYTYMYPADTEGVLDPEQFEEDKGWGDDEVDDEGFPSQRNTTPFGHGHLNHRTTTHLRQCQGRDSAPDHTPHHRSLPLVPFRGELSVPSLRYIIADLRAEIFDDENLARTIAFGHEIWSQVEDERRARGEVVVEAVEMSEEMERKRREEAVAALPVICQREGARDERDERDEESRFVARIKATYKEANYDFDKDEDDLYGA